MSRKGVNWDWFLKVFIFGPFVLFLSFGSLWALPEGETVIEGQASFDRSEANTLKINTSSDKLIIDYSNFSIANNESVYFYQPSFTSSALNRVTGSEVSNIFGTLSANGIIFLINTNGVNIGSSATINTGGLVVSTLNIANSDFLSGNYVFSKLLDKVGRPVINNGYIKVRETGMAVLLGSALANSGTIETTLGSVVLAAGEKITLNLDTAGMISVVIDEPVKEEIFGFGGEKLGSAVENSGTILNPGGKVILAAKALNHVFDYAINNSGIIKAESLINHDGVVELIAEGAPIINTGTIVAGEVKVNAPLTEFVNKGDIITDGSSVSPDGGRISVEAGIIVHEGGIFANAFEGGDAGEITIISESSTVLGAGSETEARALGIVGNGGRIIINSRNGDSFVGKDAVIDVSAGLLSGNAGFIEVSAFGQLGFYGVLSARAPPGFQAGIAILDPTDATVSGTFAANTTIWATNNITINGNITINRGFTLTLLADHLSATAGDWDDGIGTITRSGNFTITGQAGNPSQIRGLVMKAGSGIGTSSTPILTERITDMSADLNPNAGSGGIFISQSGSLDLTVASATTKDGDISITSENNMTVTTATAGGTGVIIFEVSGTSKALTTGAITAVDNNITLTADSINITGTVNAGTGDITLQPASANRAININSGGSNFSLTVTELTNLSSSGTVIIGRTDGAGSITIGSDGAVDLSAEDYNLTLRSSASAITISGALTLKSGKTFVADADTNTFTQDAAINVGSGTIQITAGTITLNSTVTATGNITLNGNTTFTGTLTLGTGALFTINGNLSITLAAAVLNASSGTIDLNGDFIQSAGTFTAPAGNFNISGSFTHTAGTFNANSGTIIFDGTAASTISGSTTFFNFTSTVLGKEFTFEAGSTQTIQGTLTLTGASGNLIILRSSISGTQWGINIEGSASVSFVDVKDSNGINAADIRATDSKDSGNNTNWYLVDHFIITGASIQTAGATNLLTITAIDGTGGISTSFNGDKTLTFSGASSASSFAPTAINNSGIEVGFGTATGITFSNGISSVLIKLFKIETASISATDGISLTNASLSVSVVPDAAVISQLSSADISRIPLPDARELTIYQFNIFAPGGLVYFYHPLTPADFSAFDEMFGRRRR